MENEITDIQQQSKVSFSRYFWLILIIMAGLYYCWPTISQLNILSPYEQEVHGYLKEIIPAVRSTLQKFKQMDEEAADPTFAAELEDLSNEILAINNKYWERGSRSETFVQIIINKIWGKKGKETFFLTHWTGPEKDRKSLDNMRMDTRTLIYRAWVIKEDSNKLASALKNMPMEWEVKGKGAIQGLRPLIEDSWRVLADADQVHRRWKGNYRSPFAFSSEKGKI